MPDGFSGEVAARVMACLKSHPPPDLVVVFGMHMHAHGTPCLMATGGFDTPLGPVDVHEPYARRLADAVGCRQDTPDTFPCDNTIEVQLPMIRHFFPGAAVVAAGVPPGPPARPMGRAAAQIARDMGLSAVFIGSTDLTHYGEAFGFTPAGTGAAARKWVETENDARAVEAILDMDDKKILEQARDRHNMCCAGAVVAAVAAARVMGACQGKMLTYTTSFDKNPGNTLVGYTGIVFGT